MFRISHLQFLQPLSLKGVVIDNDGALLLDVSAHIIDEELEGAMKEF
jgi:hypothetical protein